MANVGTELNRWFTAPEGWALTTILNRWAFVTSGGQLKASTGSIVVIWKESDPTKSQGKCWPVCKSNLTSTETDSAEKRVV